METAGPEGGKIRRRRRSSDELMQLLLEAARTEFAARGFAGATTAAIARRADATEAQLFRYFASKAELFAAAIFEPLNRDFAHFYDNTTERDPSDDRRTTADYIRALRRFIGDNAQMLMSLVVVQTYATDGVKGVGHIDSLDAYFERGAVTLRQRLHGPATVPPELMARVSFAAILGCVLFKEWIFPPEIADDARIEKAIADFVMNGLAANPDPAFQEKE